MKLMNPNYSGNGGSLYWHATSGNCYNGKQNANVSCNFTTTGLKMDAKNYMATTIWYTGSFEKTVSYSNISTHEYYKYERSENHGKICSSAKYCNDTITRKIQWNGFVGLIYSSDYGYATSGGSTKNRKECLDIPLYSWHISSNSDCKQNNWLYQANTYQWALSPLPYSGDACSVLFIYSETYTSGGNDAYRPHAIKPVVYLKPEVKITGGVGTMQNPFSLSMD